MEAKSGPGLKGPGFSGGARKAVRLLASDLVEMAPYDGGQGLPWLITPRRQGVDLVGWAAAERPLVDELLLRHGALLFRGFSLQSQEDFEAFTRALAPELLDYQERAAPRREVGKKIYTSTEYPPDQEIPQHHEMSYSHNWPTKLWFFCATPPATEGCTPITSDRDILPRIDPEVRELFERKKLMYTRNYGEGVDLPWQEVFQTADKAAVEAYCRECHMQVEWRDHDRLRTRAVRQAVAIHPKTAEKVWFNHAHLFHVSSLPPAVQSALLSEFAPDELPRNAFLGDGSPIEPEVLAEIRRLYSETAVRFPWQQGDVLMVDNFLVSHGREPFTGPRKILVAMAEMYTNSDL